MLGTPAKKTSDADGLDPKTRAEDVLLGSLGFDESAHIKSVWRTEEGYAGIGIWSDGESFDFESDSELDELQRWALTVLLENE